MRGETMKDKSKKSTYSTTFGVDPLFGVVSTSQLPNNHIRKPATQEELRALKWCQRVDSDHRPKAYESSALPLSYSGNF